ncbi:hypothetical protein ACFO4N_02715 [Camelliibacillus cellulosilyticus]|uniref:Membrane protein DUF2178 n=1 Tax=Camelliibacillus cellulosilyticus TaxID=2174486 RepID=A0ABV9GKI9_9BACL
MQYRTLYIILGSFLFIFMGIILVSSALAGDFHPLQIYPMALIAVVCLCNAYLAPQLAKKDERAQYIRQKGMFYAYFAIIGYLLILMLAIYFTLLVISALHVVMLMIFLIVVTIFIAMVIVAKIN